MTFIRFAVLIDWLLFTAQAINGAFAAYQDVRTMNANLFLSQKALLVQCLVRSIVKLSKQRHMTFRGIWWSWHLNTDLRLMLFNTLHYILGLYILNV